MLDPRTRNAALPVSLTGEPFDLMLPTSAGRVVPVTVRPEMPEGGSGVSVWRFAWDDQPHKLVVRVHDGLYNRGLAVRGVNRTLAAHGAPWRYRELLVGAIPLLVLTEPDGPALARLLALDWVRPLPANGIEGPTTDRALLRTADLRALGAIHAGLGDDLVRRAFSGQRRFLDGLDDDLLGNHVAVLDGLSVFHMDSLRTFDGDRHEEFANGLFRIIGPDCQGAQVTDLDSTPTEEGRTELDFDWGDQEYRVVFDQEPGVIELRIAHAFNELLRRGGAGGRLHALSPVSHVTEGDPGATLLITYLAEAHATALRERGLVRFADDSLDPASLSEDERLPLTEI